MNKLFKKQGITVGLLLFLVSFCYRPVFALEDLVPVGQTVGVTLKLDGISIADTAEVKDCDGKFCAPAREAGLQSGDIIKKINGAAVDSVEALEKTVNAQGDKPMNIEYTRNGENKTAEVTAATSADDGLYRLGIWIKDAVSGIGTITYYNPQTKEFGALGHGISETPSDGTLEVSGGDVLQAEIVSVQKGERGNPGELIGVFSEGEGKLGTVTSNSSVGLKGKIESDSFAAAAVSAIPTAAKDEVTEGAAEIAANVEKNSVDRYSVEIQKINKDSDDAKGMIIKVTDKRLLEKTGGIVRGMSGCPIIQNGRLVGAVTHVLVNDPTRGYGIFIENMLAEAKK